MLVNKSLEKIFKTILFIIIFLSAIISSSQTNWFVNKQIGLNSNNGLSTSSPFKTVEYAINFVQPGDTILIMDAYSNDNFNSNYTYSGNINDPYIWSQENTIKINNLHGNSENYITIKSYNKENVIRGDGANIFRVTNSSYIRIEGLELSGQVENISLETALALQFLYRESGSNNTLYRVPPGTTDQEIANMTFPILDNIKRPSYTDTRGFYLSNVHHIDLINNTIHHTPGNGFRVADCEFINVEGNEIHNTSRKSYSGTHALVITKTKSTNNYSGYKVKILRNKVHHNYNEIYSWAPSKTFITPRIDEGKGISLQRNNESSWINGNGRILVENNVCYWNGFSGIHSNDGYRIDFINNTCYMNSYTNTITYAGKEQKGNNIGISTQRGTDIKIINNISVIDTDWNGYALAASNSSELVVRNNLIFGNGLNTARIDDIINTVDVNTINKDPLFVNSSQFDFNIQDKSPVIGHADQSFAPEKDYYKTLRDSNPDTGGIEYITTLGLEEELLKVESIYPNPFKNKIFLRNIELNNKELKIYNLLGQVFNNFNDIKLTNNGAEIDTSGLPRGIYFIRTGKKVHVAIKSE